MFPIKVNFGGDNAEETRATSMHVSLPSSLPIKRYDQKTIKYQNKIVAILRYWHYRDAPTNFDFFYSEILLLTSYSNRTSCKDTGRLPSLNVMFLASFDRFFILCIFGSVLSRSSRKRTQEGQAVKVSIGT